ncbi:MAG: hypothetical protein WCI73_04475, partial [Phycisphaerae bacterium]
MRNIRTTPVRKRYKIPSFFDQTFVYRFLTGAVLLLVGLLSGLSAARAEPWGAKLGAGGQAVVTATGDVDQEPLVAGQSANLAVRLEIAAGYHI